MLRFWRIFNRIGLVLLALLVRFDAYAWIGPQTPDRLFSSVLLGGMAGLAWALFGAAVDRMLE